MEMLRIVLLFIQIADFMVKLNIYLELLIAPCS